MTDKQIQALELELKLLKEQNRAAEAKLDKRLEELDKRLVELKAQGEQSLRELKAQGEQTLRELKAQGDQSFRELKAQGEQSLRELKAQGEQTLRELKAQGDQSFRELKERGEQAQAETTRKLDGILEVASILARAMALSNDRFEKEQIERQKVLDTLTANTNILIALTEELKSRRKNGKGDNGTNGQK
jgi:hypothetical protein